MPKKIFTNHAVLASAERGASSGYSSYINASSEEYIFIETVITAKSGAPTLDMVLQCSPVDPALDSTRWATAAVESQITNANIGSTFPKIFRSVAHPDFVGWVRVLYTVGGTTTPKLTFRINFQSK
jgi:hypothetical protein